jgi:hypothetical protein
MNVMQTLASMSTGTLTPASSIGNATGGGLIGSTVMKLVTGSIAALGIFIGVNSYFSTDQSGQTPGTPSGQEPSIPAVTQPQPARTDGNVTPSQTQEVPDGQRSTAAQPDASRESVPSPDDIFVRRSTQTTPGATVITPDSVHIQLKLDVNKQKREE